MLFKMQKDEKCLSRPCQITLIKKVWGLPIQFTLRQNNVLVID